MQSAKPTERITKLFQSQSSLSSEAFLIEAHILDEALRVVEKSQSSLSSEAFLMKNAC